MRVEGGLIAGNWLQRMALERVAIHLELVIALQLEPPARMHSLATTTLADTVCNFKGQHNTGISIFA